MDDELREATLIALQKQGIPRTEENIAAVLEIVEDRQEQEEYEVKQAVAQVMKKFEPTFAAIEERIKFAARKKRKQQRLAAKRSAWVPDPDPNDVQPAMAPGLEDAPENQPAQVPVEIAANEPITSAKPLDVSEVVREVLAQSAKPADEQWEAVEQEITRDAKGNIIGAIMVKRPVPAGTRAKDVAPKLTSEEEKPYVEEQLPGGGTMISPRPKGW